MRGNSLWKHAVGLSLLMSFLLMMSFASRANGNDDVVIKLLTDYWSPIKKRESTLFFDSQASPSKKVLYAYALVKSRQHDVDKAISVIDRLEELDPANSLQLRLKTWLLLRREKFDAAVVTLTRFIEKVKADGSLDDFSRLESYRFAGRVFGFLDGPASSRVNPVTRESSRRKVLMGIDADLKDAFDLDYSAVRDEYRDLINAKGKAEKTALDADIKQRQIKFAQLIRTEAQLDESQKRLNSQAIEIRENVNRELLEIRESDRQWSSRQAALESDLAGVQNELFLLANDVAYWRHLWIQEEEVFQRGYYIRRIQNLDFLIFDRRSDAAVIRGELNGIVSQRDGLQARYAQLSGGASRQLASIQTELKNVTQLQRRTANEKINTTKPSKKIVTRSVSLKTKAKSITTYDKFPLEMERQLVLDSLD